MGQPVVHFEIIGADPERLRDYYGELFGWEFDTSGGVAESVSEAGNYGFVQNPDGAGIPGGVGGGGSYPAAFCSTSACPTLRRRCARLRDSAESGRWGRSGRPIAGWSSAISPTPKATSSASREPHRKVAADPPSPLSAGLRYPHGAFMEPMPPVDQRLHLGFHTGHWQMRTAPRRLRLNRHSKGAAFAPHTTEPCQELQMNTTPKSAVASSNGSRVAMRAALIAAIREES